MVTVRVKNSIKTALKILGVLLVSFASFQCTQSNRSALKINKGAHIIVIGNNLGSRMMNYRHFETEMHLR